ncbi:hypothetical protein HE1_00360 [Holospora elegans E1]|uniref:Uncharacterized protein n=1 Tax=Holospora elegans E1 TaxID=1427503 RepID=A0A023DYI7_9PROT|nr:hypothetical protein HE1_00360 [Holospora elegans E1]
MVENLLVACAIETDFDYIKYCITPLFFVVFAFIAAIKMMLYHIPISLLNHLVNSSSTPPGLLYHTFLFMNTGTV